MTEQITKTQRLLDLIAFLVGRRYPVDIDEVMDGVPAYRDRWADGSTDKDSIRRIFQRDKAELRELGIPIETVSYVVGHTGEKTEGYRLTSKDFYLPYLKLAGTEAPSENPTHSWSGSVEIERADAQVVLEALRVVERLPAFPLRDEARSAFRKLAFDLDPSSFPSADVIFPDRPGAEELRWAVGILSDAVLAKKRVRFTYAGIYRGVTTERRVDPYGLVFQHGHWYLVGHDHLRDAIRVFRVSRMSEISGNQKAPKTPDYSVPADFSLSDYVDKEAWELGGDDEPPLTADVYFEFPTTLWADANGYGEKIEEDAEGGTVRRFQLYSPGPFLRWLLSLQGKAKLLSPPELQTEFREMAIAVAERHATAGAVSG